MNLKFKEPEDGMTLMAQTILQNEIFEVTGVYVSLFSETIIFDSNTLYSDVVEIMKILEPHLE